jgi:hypothetical protein
LRETIRLLEQAIEHALWLDLGETAQAGRG